VRFWPRRKHTYPVMVRFCEIQVPVGLRDEQWIRLVDAIESTAQRGLIDSPFWRDMTVSMGYKTIEVDEP